MAEGLLWIAALIAVAVAASSMARRLGLLTPIVLILVGFGLSFIPVLPPAHLEPEIVLIGFLPPLLYVAALEMSVPAFKFNLRPILLLAVGLVLFTTAAVGLAVHTMLPFVPLAACVALGAVVAPPDAIAATAVARRIGLPRRIVTILEGESLLNDATALVVFGVALTVMDGEAVGGWEIAGDALRAAGGGVAVGALGAVVVGYLHKRAKNPLTDNAISLLTPIMVALAAERLHVSAVVAVVVTGLYLGHRLPVLMSAASRLQMGAFWRLVKFLLESMVFLLVGLQLQQVVANLSTPDLTLPKLTTATVIWTTVVVLLVVIVTRFVWMYPATYLPRLIPAVRRRDPNPPFAVPTVLAWAGMRGVVTLATALALPLTLAGEASYPRDLFIWLAFAVIMVTLLLQATTLPAVARWLRLPGDDPTQDILAEAATQHAASRAAGERLEQHADSAPAAVVERLRQLNEARANMAWERLGHGQETPSQAYIRLRRHMLEAERDVFRSARDGGRIPEEVLRRAQRDMDLEEALLERSDDE